MSCPESTWWAENSYNQGFGEDPRLHSEWSLQFQPHLHLSRQYEQDCWSAQSPIRRLSCYGARKMNSVANWLAGSVPGYLTFNPSLATTTLRATLSRPASGKHLQLRAAGSFREVLQRYKILEPYSRTDFHVTNRLTLNLACASACSDVSRKVHQAFNFDPAHYISNRPPSIQSAVSSRASEPIQRKPVSLTNLPNGIVQCGVTPGVPVSCMKGHLFNPAPRIGFAFDPKGDGKTRHSRRLWRLFEHTNGNEGTPSPWRIRRHWQHRAATRHSGLLQYRVSGRPALPQFALGVVSIPTKAVWPYMQQWHFDIQHEIASAHPGASVVRRQQGTHLTRISDYNQLMPVAASQNPFLVNGEPMGGDCGPTLDAFNVPTNGRTGAGVPVPYGASRRDESGSQLWYREGLRHESRYFPQIHRVHFNQPYPGRGVLHYHAFQPLCAATYEALTSASPTRTATHRRLLESSGQQPGQFLCSVFEPRVLGLRPAPHS